MEDQARKERVSEGVLGLAENHVDWFLGIIRPLLISHFVHGYKHGQENPTVNEEKS
jgi:hypothetical protein